MHAVQADRKGRLGLIPERDRPTGLVRPTPERC